MVTHRQLSSGYQTAQTAHVAAEFVLQLPEVAKTWNSLSGYLIVLEADDTAHLAALEEQAAALGIRVVGFREPDLDDELTALAFTPGAATRRLLSNLGCAGRKSTEAEQSKLRAREARMRNR